MINYYFEIKLPMQLAERIDFPLSSSMQAIVFSVSRASPVAHLNSNWHVTPSTGIPKTIVIGAVIPVRYGVLSIKLHFIAKILKLKFFLFYDKKILS